MEVLTLRWHNLTKSMFTYLLPLKHFNKQHAFFFFSATLVMFVNLFEPYICTNYISNLQTGGDLEVWIARQQH